MILALDISKKRTGYAHDAPAGELPDYGSFTGAAACKSNGAAGFAFARWLTDLCKRVRPALIVAERPLQARANSTGTSHLLGGLVFTAGVVGFGFKARLEVIDAQTWRKGVLGIGRPVDPKAAALQHCALLGLSPSNDDEADAVCLWLHAAALARQRRVTGLEQGRLTR